MDPNDMDSKLAAYLHEPGRIYGFGSLEDHLVKASALARALYLLVTSDNVDIADVRDRAAVHELVSAVAQETSAAEYLFSLGDAASSRKSAAPSDPIFAAIERHKAARAALDAAFVPGDASAADHAVISEASGKEDEALRDLVKCAPATRAGFDAALHWLADPRFAESEALADFVRNAVESSPFFDQARGARDADASA